MELEPISAQTADGWTLAGDLRLPEAEPVATAVLGHAMMVTRTTMDKPRGQGLASTLLERGFAVLNFDLRGHGQSRPTAREGGRWTYHDHIAHDQPAMWAVARERFPNLPLALVGHSMGCETALIASGLYRDEAPDAILGYGPAFWTPSMESSKLMTIVEAGVLVVAEAVALAMGCLDAPRLRLGSAAEPEPFMRHQCKMFFTDRIGSPDGEMDYTEVLALSRTPVRVYSSERDRFWARPVATRRLLAKMIAAPVAQIVLPDGPGRPEPDHMAMVLSPKSRPLWEEGADWLVAELV